MNFASSVYEHGARLIGCTPWETSRMLLADRAQTDNPESQQ
jgi:hypothetical protein